MNKSEIAKFREALKNGEVLFTYTKKDGSLRRAVGTLCVKLIPKETPMDTYEITCIEWDIDGEWKSELESDPNASREEFDKIVANLPVRCKVKIFADTPEDEIECELSQALTEEYGFCHNGFGYAKLEKKHKKLKEGMVFYYDCEKNGYRSFNESQLAEFIQH